MQTLALVCQKGGAGKTTLAIHLAAEAATNGLRTLLLDLDPQASAARWADRRKPGAIDVDVAVGHLPASMLRCGGPSARDMIWWSWTLRRMPIRPRSRWLASQPWC